jgi:zinc and cadmium transporter
MLFELVASLIIISLASLIGVFTLGIKSSKLEHFLEWMVAFAIGALLGDVFIHLLPELGENGFSLDVSLTILLGIILFFILEKFIHWHHCHHAAHKNKCESYGYMSLAGDVLHNFIDGAILAGAFIISPIVGFSTAIAILLHELPQEIGDFGIMLSSGFSQKKALAFNFIVSLTAFLGAGVALLSISTFQSASPYIVAIAVGGFLYLAGTDLLPQLNKKFSKKQAILQLFFILVWVAVMSALLLLE